MSDSGCLLSNCWNSCRASAAGTARSPAVARVPPEMCPPAFACRSVRPGGAVAVEWSPRVRPECAFCAPDRPAVGPTRDSAFAALWNPLAVCSRGNLVRIVAALGRRCGCCCRRLAARRRALWIKVSDCDENIACQSNDAKSTYRFRVVHDARVIAALRLVRAAGCGGQLP